MYGINLLHGCRRKGRSGKAATAGVRPHETGKIKPIHDLQSAAVDLENTIMHSGGSAIGMVSGKTRKVVVIRDIHSNIIEEAILVLREVENGDSCSSPSNKKRDERKESRKQDLLLKEANLIIENYIRECKIRGLAIAGEKTRQSFFSRILSKNFIINFALAGSLLLLAFLLIRLM